MYHVPRGALLSSSFFLLAAIDHGALVSDDDEIQLIQLEAT
jgi:hypothetical protein